MLADLIARVGLCLCICFCTELAFLSMLGCTMIGRGTEASDEFFMSLTIGSVVLIPASLYFGWRCTENQKIS